MKECEPLVTSKLYYSITIIYIFMLKTKGVNHIPYFGQHTVNNLPWLLCIV